MPNQRKEGTARITVTLPDEMLADLEQAAQETGLDRLALTRMALQQYLKARRPKAAKTAAKPTAKGK